MKTNIIKTTLDRPQFLRTGAAAFTGAELVPAADTYGKTNNRGDDIDEDLHRPPGFYRFSVNDVEISVLSNGVFHPPSEIFVFNAEPEMGDKYFIYRLIPGIHSVLDMMDGQLRRIRARDEVVSGIRSIASPENTPGNGPASDGLTFTEDFK